jgi:putative phage-type endonuclease
MKNNHIDVEQRSDAWFLARKGRVTASIAGALLGIDPLVSTSQAIKRILPIGSQMSDNQAMCNGRIFEDFAREDFEIETGLQVEQCGFFTYEDWLGGSPDGLVSDGSIIEIKIPYSAKDFVSIYAKPHYYAQVQICMHLTGKHKAYFYQWSSTKKSMLEIVQYDLIWIQANLPILQEIHKMIHTPPEHLNEMVIKYKTMTDSIKELEIAKKELLDQIVWACDDKETIVGEHVVKLTTRKGTVDYKRLCSDAGLNPEDYRGSDLSYWSIK